MSSSHPTTQITLLQKPTSDNPNPQVSIEVDDVDGVHDKAVERGLQIVYPLTNEPWGVRRFFVTDPNGTIINVIGHLE